MSGSGRSIAVIYLVQRSRVACRLVAGSSAFTCSIRPVLPCDRLPTWCRCLGWLAKCCL